MIFRARLRRQSAIWRLWREGRRVSGELHGVVFRYVPGDDYETDDLLADQITLLQQHSDVDVTVHGHTTATPIGVLMEPLYYVIRNINLPAEPPVPLPPAEPPVPLPPAEPRVAEPLPATPRPAAAPAARPVIPQAPVTGSWSKNRRARH